MNAPLPFFNFSLKKLLASEPDSFARAKLRILVTVLTFSLVKLVVAAPVIFTRNLGFQRTRLLLMFIIYTVLLKLALSSRKLAQPITHAMLWIGVALIWSVMFVTAQSISVVNIQFIFMLILSSFYLLDRRWGIFYAVLGVLPVGLFLTFGKAVLPFHMQPDVAPSPIPEIFVILNFVTIVLSHYLYHQAFSRNIEEKEQLNIRLQAAVQDANRAAKSKSDFLSTMSHELRTPLNSVIGMTELLLESPHDEEQAENLGILSFSAVSLHSLINDILDFNKMDSHKVRLECIDVDLHALVNQICSGFRQQAKEKGLALDCRIDDSLAGLHVKSDPTRITQIIYNLVSNAIKFTHRGSVTIGVEELGRSAADIRLRFSVTDTGIGIAPEKSELVFEPFVQASTSTTREFGGTGLGLAIVSHLLLLFNSRVDLRSEPGQGSVFAFELTLPVVARRADALSPDPDATYDLSGLRVLVAEDNVINRTLLKKVFAKWNNEPAFASDGREALEKVARQIYDVILMDIHMPLMDGYEATKAIRDLPNPAVAGVPIIALTASVSDNLHEKIVAAGMNDYLCKPFSAKDLYARLKEVAVASPQTLPDL